jgi:hypothetical protein
MFTLWVLRRAPPQIMTQYAEERPIIADNGREFTFIPDFGV